MMRAQQIEVMLAAGIDPDSICRLWRMRARRRCARWEAEAATAAAEQELRAAHARTRARLVRLGWGHWLVWSGGGMAAELEAA